MTARRRRPVSKHPSPTFDALPLDVVARGVSLRRVDPVAPLGSRRHPQRLATVDGFPDPTARQRHHRSPQAAAYRATKPWRSLVWESTCGIVVNVVITGAALSGAVRLLPLQMTQQNRLQLLRQDVHQLHQRVSQLRTQFERSMDPLQTQALIKERENYVPPNHIHLQLVPPQTMTGFHDGLAP
ncbi:MAG: hypothetical protein OHK0012_27680 [Synechococcales cyanobacterium]